MQIVINIPDDAYEEISNARFPVQDAYRLLTWIKDDTPLPKSHKRKFEEIVVEYPPAELCTYPEYRGKPYFSIKYEENREYFIGFGTYDPQIFSRYLREYFIAPTIIETNKEGENKK